MLWTNHLQEAHAKNWKCMPKLNYAQDRKDHLSKPVTTGKQAKKGWSVETYERCRSCALDSYSSWYSYETYLVWVIVRSCVLFTLPKETVWKVPELVLCISYLFSDMFEQEQEPSIAGIAAPCLPAFSWSRRVTSPHLAPPSLSLVEKAAVHFPLPELSRLSKFIYSWKKVCFT